MDSVKMIAAPAVDDSLAHGEHAAGAVPAGSAVPAAALDAQVAACMDKWLSIATDPACADTRMFAKLIAARDARNELALLGLQPHEWRTLLARHFTHAQTTAPALPVAAAVTVNIVSASTTASTTDHTDFIRSLHALLLTHADPGVDADDAHCVATIIAHACLRPDHLWRDLGLAGRDEVTWMLTRYFPTLVALNVANLRWKKFLAAQRALSLGLPPGPAPGCPGCEDYGYCFPPQP
jgi:nitrogen fixation protein NifQ